MWSFFELVGFVPLLVTIGITLPGVVEERMVDLDADSFLFLLLSILGDLDLGLDRDLLLE